MVLKLNIIDKPGYESKNDVEPQCQVSFEPEIISPKFPVKQGCSKSLTWKVIALTMGFCLLAVLVFNTFLLLCSSYSTTPTATTVHSEILNSTLAVPSYDESNLGNDVHIFKRDQWGGLPIRNGYQNRTLVHPINLVVISHTASRSQCMTLETCAHYLQAMQSEHVSDYNYVDIKWNFLVGGDGNIYEALGWDIQNYLRNNSIQISFIGNYIYDRVMDRQRMAVQALLKRGVELGKLDEDYRLIAHSQIVITKSPGTNLLADIKQWPHYHNDESNLGNDVHIFKRDQWGGLPIRDGYQNRTLVHPINLVVISHTGSINQCMTFETCAHYLQTIQSDHVSDYNYVDIKWNFLVGGNGNIYEALGWDIQNYLRNNSIQISFIGNYIYDRVMDRQRMSVQALLKRGVELGKLDEDYRLVAHSQIVNTKSPGTNLLADIKQWPHYYNGTLP